MGYYEVVIPDPSMFARSNQINRTFQLAVFGLGRSPDGKTGRVETKFERKKGVSEEIARYYLRVQDYQLRLRRHSRLTMHAEGRRRLSFTSSVSSKTCDAGCDRSRSQDLQGGEFRVSLFVGFHLRDAWTARILLPGSHLYHSLYVPYQ